MKMFKCEKKMVETKSRDFDFAELYDGMGIYDIQREFNELVETLTEENSEKCDIRYVHYYEHDEGSFIFYREETDEEFRERWDREYGEYYVKLEAEKKRKERDDQKEYEREKAEYRRLKAKFENV